MQQVIVTWSSASDPDTFSFELYNANISFKAVTQGSMRSYVFTLSPGKYHFEIWSVKSGVESAHVTQDFVLN